MLCEVTRHTHIAKFFYSPYYMTS